MTDSTELVVFVASPSDVEEERAAVKDVVERIENSLGVRHGIRIRVTGWEQVPPGYGRPQDQINPLVDKCDIFIGILHSRWGSESGTHSSGFIEEFERAVERLDENGEPAIAMFFKRVPQSQRDDAGPQLQQVIDFQELIRREHMLLYRDFADTADFKQQLMDLLVYHASEMINPPSAAPASPSENPTPASNTGQDGAADDAIDTAVGATPLNDAQTQLIGVLAAYSALINGAVSHPGRDDDRLLLFASAVCSEPLLPTHEANRLYRRRSELSLVSGEKLHWLRSMAGDWSRDREYRTIPGWNVIGADAIEEYAETLLEDSSAGVTAGSLRLMTAIAHRPKNLWPGATLDSEESDIRKVIERWQSLLAGPGTANSAIAHLSGLASPADLPLLDLLNSEITGEAARNDIRIIHSAISGDLSKLVAAVITSQYQQKWQTDRLAAALPHLEVTQLIALLSAESNLGIPLKRVATLQIVSRGELNGHIVAAALGSKNDDVAKIIVDASRQLNDAADIFRAAIEELSDAGQGIERLSMNTDVVPRILAETRTAEELRPGMALDADKWEARLYQKGADGTPDARVILSAAEDTWADVLPAQLRAALEEKDLISYVYARHVVAALRYLSQLVTVADEDLNLIRARLDSPQHYVQAEAVDALGRCGTVSDGTILLAASATTSAINRDRTLRAALALGGPEVVEAATETTDRATAAVIAPFLAQLSQAKLQTLLTHSDATIRIAAFDELARQLDDQQLYALFDYLADKRYFYNVVVALDETLYGPPIGRPRAEGRTEVA